MKATLIIQNIDSLITLNEKEVESIQNGLVILEDEKIIHVGQGEIPDGIETDNSTIIIDGKGKTVTPGLIDSHTHLVHGGSREKELSMKLKGVPYLDILAAGGGIHSTVNATINATSEELYDKALKSLEKMLSFGVTTVEAKSGYGIEDFNTELKQLEVAKKLDENHPIDIISTFMGAHAIPEKYKDNPEVFVDIIVNEMIPEVGRKKLAAFCDVFCEQGVFTIEQSKRILLAGRKYGMEAKIHADEIHHLGGAELAAEIGCISADHLIAASDKGIEMIAKKGVVANLLPGTSFNLQAGHYARARKMIDMGVDVALSTDYNPGSCPTENLQLIMSFASLIMKMTPFEVIKGVTLNGAKCLGIENLVGSIEVGKIADITIFDSNNIDYVIYHFGINHTDTVIKRGKVVYKS